MTCVIDELTREKIDITRCRKIVSRQLSNGMIVFGYVKMTKDTIPKIGKLYIKYGRSLREIQVIKENFSPDNIFFSNYRGRFISKIGLSNSFIRKEIEVKGVGEFPYDGFQKRYEAIESFDVFKDKQIVEDITNFPLAEKLKYTFGLEFETSAGYISEEACYKTGLIPLRDGSITGLEYSTVVLEGNNGLNLLKEQLRELREHTTFDKECSLHVHLGNYPIEPEKIFSLYKTCKGLENELKDFVPAYTFNTANYKATRKDYCKKLPVFINFKDMYHKLVGRNYLGSLVQPHPNDITRQRKWQINTRYFWVNFINMICYDVNKTVEFRFLRPTYNLKKILVWLYIMNAILIYSEKLKPKPAKLKNILNYVYGKGVSDILMNEVEKLHKVVEIQTEKQDYIGENIDVENEWFPMDEII